MPDHVAGPTSRDIPDPIMREVRRRCGFGCIVCGLPLYEYDHVIDWAVAHKHDPDEIVLLCDRHHREKTSGLLPMEPIAAAQCEPHNLKAGISEPYDLHYSGGYCRTVIGGNSFSTRDHGYGTTFAPLIIDDRPLVGFVLADGHLLLDLVAFDPAGNEVLQIVRNQLVYSISPWDIQLTGRNLVIREAARHVLIDIVFNPPSEIIIQRGRFLYDDVELVITPRNALLVNNQIVWTGSHADDVAAGIVIGGTERKCAWGIRAVERPVADRPAALRWVRQQLQDAGE